MRYFFRYYPIPLFPPLLSHFLLQIQLERNFSYTYETVILENLDGLLERHAVLCGQGETFNGRKMEWKIASTKKEQIDDWMTALSSVKLSLYYQPLYGESEMLSHLAQKMMNSISISDRWYYFKVYTSCFIGTEAVIWLQSDLNCSKQEAIQIGNKMLNLNFFYHVVREHFFCDSYYFYRFNKVIRSVNQVKKKRLSTSSLRGSLSYFDSTSTSATRSTSSLMDGSAAAATASTSGRLGENYCVCDLYPRQSEILSHSTENLTLLVDEINTMYSFQSGDISLLSTSEEEGEEGEGSHLKPEDKHEEVIPQGTTSTSNNKEVEREGGRFRSCSSSESHRADDWKIGSLESQGSGHLQERSDGEDHR
jgi:hypothetical protein